MARIEVSTHVEAPPARVWQVLTDWEAQPRWMVDARSVTILTPRRAGTGTILRCRMRFGPLLLDDDMEVTEWQPDRVAGVRHLGHIVRGVGAFELDATPYGTHLVWWEETDPPLGALGEALTQVLVAPAVTRTFRRSVANLKQLCESGPGV